MSISERNKDLFAVTTLLAKLTERYSENEIKALIEEAACNLKIVSSTVRAAQPPFFNTVQ